jgi:Na+/H+ antiporter NhaD/arsenite permease-like protein
LILLFAFMVLSAQLRLSGFYSYITYRLAMLPLAPPLLLGTLIGMVGALSAVFSNDIICLAMAPVLADACLRRRLDPVPYLLGLACAANVGSALTLIGNPQNMLIGESLRLSFGGYLRETQPQVDAGDRERERLKGQRRHPTSVRKYFAAKCSVCRQRLILEGLDRVLGR